MFYHFHNIHNTKQKNIYHEKLFIHISTLKNNINNNIGNLLKLNIKFCMSYNLQDIIFIFII